MRRPLPPRLAFAAVAVFAALAPSCSSKQGTVPTGGGVTGTPQDESDGAVAPYPTRAPGTSQRGLNPSTNAPNTTPGSVIQNFKFLGYPNADPSKGLQTIALSDYYDPTAKKFKVLHITAAAEWCDPCNAETTAILTDLATPATDWEAQGVVYLQALIEGFGHNVGATQTDLNAWITKEKPTFTEVLDPEASQLGIFFDAAAVPFNADIDVRSMEVLQAGTGGTYDPSSVQVWLTWVNDNPPAYAQ